MNSSNIKYWHQLALLTEKTPSDPDPSSGPHILGSWARDYAQKGISLIMERDFERARLFIVKARNLILQKIKVHRESSDLSWLFILKCLEETEPERSHLLSALEENQRELEQKITAIGNKNLYEYFAGIKLTPNALPVSPGTGPSADQPDLTAYTLTTAAYYFVEFARRALLSSKFDAATKAAEAVENICRISVQQIPYTLALENPRWKIVEKNMSNLTKLKEKEKNEYLEERKNLSGPIPRILKMAEIIRQISDTVDIPRELSGRIKGNISVVITDLNAVPEKVFESIKTHLFFNPSMAFKWNKGGNIPFASLAGVFTDILCSSLTGIRGGRPLKMVEEYFETHISPPDAVFSNAGLLETMEWIVIRMRLDQIATASLRGLPFRDFVRRYLAGSTV